MKKEITYFGSIDMATPKNCYEGKTKIDNSEVSLHLHMDSKPTNDKWSDELTAYTERLGKLKPEIDKAFKTNYDEERQASDSMYSLLEQRDE